VSSEGKEGVQGGAPLQGKSAPGKKASMPRKRKSAGMWRKGSKESRGRRKSGAPCKGRSAARIVEELNRRAKEEGREALWKRCPRRGAIIRVRVDDGRGSSVVLDLQVRRKRVSCGRQPGARSDPFLEVERIELVWM